MARKEAKPIQRRGQHGLPPENDLEFCINGFCMLDGDSPSAAPDILWQQYGESIMQLQGWRHNGAIPWHSAKLAFDYFERPAIWWLAGPGSEEPRKLQSGDPAQIRTDKGYSHGLPRWFKTAEHGCTFESEKDYLIRRGLLTPAEKKLLGEQNIY